MANVFELEGSLKLNTDDYKSKLKDAGNETEKTAKELDSRTVAIGTIIANLATKAGEFFVNMAKTGIQYNAQIETYTTALTTALGNEADAAAAIERIKQDAAKTPYSVDGLVKANSYLIMAGESAEDARNTIMALGNAVSATGGGNTELQRMAQNLQQIKNVGKATSMDIRQFAMAGIDIYGVLADYTGKATSEVQNMTITYDLLSGALQNAASQGGKYFDAMSRQSQTLNGQWSTLKDNFQKGMGDAFKSVSDKLTNNVLPAANKVVTSLDWSSLLPKIGAVSAGYLAFQGVIKGVEFATKAATAAQEAWNAVMAAGTGPIGAILTVAAVATYDYARGLDNMIESQRNFNGTASEAAANLRSLTAERDQLKSAIDNGATEASLIDRYNTLNLLIPEAEASYMRLAHAEDAAGTSGDRLAQSTEAASEGVEALAETSGHTTEEIAALIDYHSKLSDAITKSVNKWFGLFDKAKTTVSVSAKDMMSNMQSQIEFNTKYSANLDYLAANGLSNLGSAFQSMGSEGAAYADAIVSAIEEAGGAASEGGQEIINSFNSLAAGVESSRGDLSDSLYSITGDLETALAKWGVSAEQAAEALNVSGSASASGAASVSAYIASIRGGRGGAYAAAESVASAAAAGFGAGGGGGGGGGRQYAPLFATGADYIPYDNYLAYLHKGEMVIPASISNDLRDFVGNGGKSPSPVKSLSIGGGNSEIVGLLKELIEVTKRPIVLDDGTLVGHTASKMDNALGDVGDLRGRGLCLA